jgi:hypothetical protein
MDQRLMNASEQIWTVPYSFSKSTKEVFNVQKAWHSPNRLSIMVHGQAFRIITCQPTYARSGSVGMSPWEHLLVPSHSVCVQMYLDNIVSILHFSIF